MWLVIVGVLSLGLGCLALVGLLAVVKQLFGESSLDANITDAGSTTDRYDVGRASGRRCGTAR
jgi:hypothetical protein